MITAAAPARGFLKSQDFVEFRALASAHGIALQPLADDLTADLSADKIVMSRPGGLSLSAVAKSATQALYHRHVLDLQSWGFDRQADFTERRTQLALAAAAAPETKRLPARCDLARFYLARDMYAEAKAVLDVAVADNPPSAEDFDADGAARHRQYHDRPSRCRHEGSRRIRSSATSTTRRCGGRWPMPGSASMRRRATASAPPRRR